MFVYSSPLWAFVQISWAFGRLSKFRMQFSRRYGYVYFVCAAFVKLSRAFVTIPLALYLVHGRFSDVMGVHPNFEGICPKESQARFVLAAFRGRLSRFRGLLSRFRGVCPKLRRHYLLCRVFRVTKSERGHSLC